MARTTPQQPGYTKRLRRLGTTIGWLVEVLARDTTLWADDVWVLDSTRWNAPGPTKRCSAAIWPGGPSTATAPRVPRKHGVSDGDILHAYTNPIRVFDLDEAFTMLIGANAAAALYEIGVIEAATAPVVVHAMRAVTSF